MSDQVRPFPDIGPAAWTVLLRAAEGQRISPDIAGQIVGPELAGEALAHLDAKHLLDDGEFSPLARTIRRWHRAPVQP